VDRTARAVEDDTGQLEVRVEPLEAQHHGRGTADECPGVQHQHHRRTEPPGNLRRRAILRHPIGPVEAAHDTLDHGQIGLGARSPTVATTCSRPHIQPSRL
jgi:hypothetical protein